MTRLQIDAVIRAAADHYGVTTEDLMGRRQFPACVAPRHAAIYVLCKNGLTLKAAAHALGRKDHTSARHALNRLRNQMSLYPHLKHDLEVIEQRGMETMYEAARRRAARFGEGVLKRAEPA